MKVLALLISLVVLVPPSAPQLGVQPNPYKIGLISFWNCEEATGASRADSFGTNTLTDTNSVAQVAGKLSNGCGFTAASSQALSASDNASTRASGALTLSCWVNPVTVNTLQQILGQWGSSTDGAGKLGYRIVILSNANIQVQVRNAGDTATAISSLASAATAGVWQLITGVYDVNTALVTVYRNTTAATAVSAPSIFVSTQPLTMGATSAVTPTNFANASIDACGYWKRALSVAEITHLYNSGTGMQYPVFEPLLPVPVFLVPPFGNRFHRANWLQAKYGLN